VPTQPKSKKGTSAVGIEALSGKGSAAASKRLIKELTKITEHDVDLEGYEVECVDDNLYHWKVKLFGFAEDTAIYKDLKSLKGDAAVELDVVFPQDYPWSPPFIRVLRPRFQFRTGHVTMGGSICMELLTKTGWAPGASRIMLLFACYSYQYHKLMSLCFSPTSKHGRFHHCSNPC
jgi:ubiquitin-conjugating enzyme E2 Q